MIIVHLKADCLASHSTGQAATDNESYCTANAWGWGAWGHATGRWEVAGCESPAI